jgi:hypothetical protein
MPKSSSENPKPISETPGAEIQPLELDLGDINIEELLPAPSSQELSLGLEGNSDRQESEDAGRATFELSPESKGGRKKKRRKIIARPKPRPKDEPSPVAKTQEPSSEELVLELGPKKSGGKPKVRGPVSVQEARAKIVAEAEPGEESDELKLPDDEEVELLPVDEEIGLLPLDDKEKAKVEEKEVEKRPRAEKVDNRSALLKTYFGAWKKRNDVDAESLKDLTEAQRRDFVEFSRAREQSRRALEKERQKNDERAEAREPANISAEARRNIARFLEKELFALEKMGKRGSLAEERRSYLSAFLNRIRGGNIGHDEVLTLLDYLEAEDRKDVDLIKTELSQTLFSERELKNFMKVARATALRDIGNPSLRAGIERETNAIAARNQEEMWESLNPKIKKQYKGQANFFESAMSETQEAGKFSFTRDAVLALLRNGYIPQTAVAYHSFWSIKGREGMKIQKIDGTTEDFKFDKKQAPQSGVERFLARVDYLTQQYRADARAEIVANLQIEAFSEQMKRVISLEIAEKRDQLNELKARLIEEAKKS